MPTSPGAGLAGRPRPTRAAGGRYYISASLLDRADSGSNAMRVPASDVEGVVLDGLHSLLSEPKSIADALLPLESDAARLDPG
jgi:hypothetical protein